MGLQEHRQLVVVVGAGAGEMPYRELVAVVEEQQEHLRQQA